MGRFGRRQAGEPLLRLRRNAGDDGAAVLRLDELEAAIARWHSVAGGVGDVLVQHAQPVARGPLPHQPRTHDRAVAIYPDARSATRSQYWMLAVMVGFTSLALWLLSQANT